MEITKQREFLEKLKHPHRDPIESDIKRWLEVMTPEGIIGKHYNRDKGSIMHTITITADDLGRFPRLDRLFYEIFPRSYAHGVAAITRSAAGPATEDDALAYSKMYMVREYL